MEILEKYRVKATVVNKELRTERYSNEEIEVFELDIPLFRSKYATIVNTRESSDNSEQEILLSPPSKELSGFEPKRNSIAKGPQHWYEFDLNRGNKKEKYDGTVFWHFDWILEHISAEINNADEDFDSLGDVPDVNRPEDTVRDYQDGLEYGNAMNIAGPIILELIKMGKLDILDDPQVVENIARKQVALAVEFVDQRKSWSRQ